MKIIKEWYSIISNVMISQVFPIDKRGIDFVGYVLYPTHILLRKGIKQRFKRMLRRNRNYKSIASYNGWLSHGDCINLKNKWFFPKNQLNL